MGIQSNVVIALQCRGDGPSGGRWLDGDTRHQTVSLAADTRFPEHSGTWWRVHDAGTDVIRLECLGHVNGDRWLDGRTTETDPGKSVRLVPTPDFGSGTRWKVHVDGNNVRLECLGDLPGNRWLDGRTADGSVWLAPTPDLRTGTRWAVPVVSNGSLQVLSTERVGQLTGNRDPEERTLLTDTTDWGVPGVDLGANTEVGQGDHRRLFIFFGDVPTADRKGGPPQDADVVASTNATDAASMVLQPVMNGPYFDPFTVEGAIGITRTGETPTGAFSYGGRTYVFIWVGRTGAGDLRPGSHLVSKQDPGQPGPYQHEFLFSELWVAKKGFFQVAPVVVRNAEHPYLPSALGDGVLLFGQGLNVDYQTDAVHLAWMPLQERWVGGRTLPGSPDRNATRYFTGNPASPWSELPDDAQPLFCLRSQYTSLSAAWLPGPRRWILLYSTSNDSDAPGAPTMARIGLAPWSWSGEIDVFNPRRERAYGHYMHWPGEDSIERTPDVYDFDEPGHPYGAFLINRFTKWDGHAKALDLYYLLSTWAPYQVQLMHSRIWLPDNPTAG